MMISFWYIYHIFVLSNQIVPVVNTWTLHAWYESEEIYIAQDWAPYLQSDRKMGCWWVAQHQRPDSLPSWAGSSQCRKVQGKTGWCEQTGERLSLLIDEVDWMAGGDSCRLGSQSAVTQTDPFESAAQCHVNLFHAEIAFGAYQD